MNAKIEKRENFDTTTEREIISTQNIDFFDIAIDAINNCFDMTNDVSKSEIFEIIFDEITDDVDIDVDSFRDEKIAKNVNIAIIAFRVEKIVNIAIIANFVFDVLIDAINDCFDVKEKINIAIFLANFDCCCNIALY